MRNKSKIYLAISLFILFTLIGVIIFLRGDFDTTTKGKIKSIQSPYEIQQDEIEVDLRGNEGSFSKKEKVYKVREYDVESFKSLLQLFEYSNEQQDYSEAVTLETSNAFMTYQPLEAMLLLVAKKELGDDFIVRTKEDVESFLSRNFSINELVFSESISGEKTSEYRGKYVIFDITVGSPFLEGDAFSIRTNPNGDIIELNLLLLKEEGVDIYQEMPISSIQELVLNRKYPKMIRHREVEERYYDSPFSFVMQEYFVNNLQSEYIFNDSVNGYILPTYKLEGEGRLATDDDVKVWSKTDVYICAISPEYLTEKPRVIPEDIIYDQPFPNPNLAP